MSFKEQVEINLAKYFSVEKMMPVRKVLKIGNTRVLSLLMFYENRKNMFSKVLSSVVYFIMHNCVCADCLCLHQSKLSFANKLFKNKTFNNISEICIPELSMNIISFHGLVNNNKSTVIL